MRLAVFVVLLCIGFVGSAKANGVDQIWACVRKNFPSKSSVQELELRSVDRTGMEKTLNAKLYWKRTADGLAEILVQVESPADVRGSAFLLLEKKDHSDMFMYLPELKKVRRITERTVSGSLFGTDFSYEDLERLQTIGAGANVTRLADVEVAGQSTYVLTGSPPPDSGSAYERVVSFIDQKTCVPLKMELYEKGGQLRKLLSADPAQVRREGGIWIPGQVSLKDLTEESETRLAVKNIAVDTEISDKIFTESALGSTGR